MKKLFRFLGRYAYAAGRFFYLFTVGAASSRHRRFIEEIWARMGAHFKARAEPILPEIELSAVVPHSASIELQEPRVADGNISLVEILVINSLIAAQRPKTLFEIGTFDGRTALNMAANSGPESLVYTLDLPRRDGVPTRLALDDRDRSYVGKGKINLRFAGTVLDKKVVPLEGDSASFDFERFYDTIDFVFVDGSHSYDYVVNDTRVAFKLLRGGKGTILWHDYGNWSSVTLALNELYLGSQAKDLTQIRGTSLVYLRRD